MAENSMMNTASEKLRIALIKQNVKVSEMAARLESSVSNISVKLKKNNLSERDLRAMADILGYDVDITLISRETGDRI